MPFSGLTAILNDVWDAITHALRVEPPGGGPFPVSGTVTANQGTPNAGGVANGWPIEGVESPNSITILAGNRAIEITGRDFLNVIRPLLILSPGDANFIGGNKIPVMALACNNGGGWIPFTGAVPQSDNFNFGNSLSVEALQYSYDPTQGTPSAPVWVRRRTINRFRSASATASGSTALWTPAAGKKFNLLRYMVIVTGNATQAAAGVLTIKLLDGASDMQQVHDVFVPNVALSTSGEIYMSPWIELGALGFLSGVANNVLNINLSAALTSGNVRVIACGTEE